MKMTKYRKLTATQIKDIYILSLQGKSGREISNAIGNVVSATSVSSLLKKLNIVDMYLETILQKNLVQNVGSLGYSISENKALDLRTDLILWYLTGENA